MIFSSPHSGTGFPNPYGDRLLLNPLQIRSSEDAFVDELFGAAPDHGSPLISARLSRAWVDLNRAPGELDPALIEGAPKGFVNSRVAAGLGVIPRVVSEGRPIISGKISMDDAVGRVVGVWQPYHRQLQSLIDEARGKHGRAILFDCHSMPDDALSSTTSVFGRKPDVVLGDRFGVACGRWLVEAATAIFSREGFRVAKNAPFAGGYITQNYGRPRRGVHALQIEINRSLYMHEALVQKSRDFDAIRARLTRAVGELTRLGASPTQVAAE
ncbi:N-formylglutamate amidohydrolase [Amaricoccus tamworthensis]|uniref:N-formylglutamate amidohydrolase n=1 Tax=Amaricoccus tamworthensis TaxID=57002 RepID=UPI003C79C9EF